MNKNNWIFDFFENDNIIDFFNQKTEDIPTSIDFFKTELNIKSFKDLVVFDQCCSSGRISDIFQKDGASVYGCDLSPKAINKAHQLNSNVKFSLINAQEYVPPELCDIAINFYSSFPYYEDDVDNDKIISKLSNSLKINGLFLMELLDSEFIINNFKPSIVVGDYERKSKIVGNILIQEWFKSNEYIITTKVKLYKRAELKKMLEKYFKNVQCKIGDMRLIYTGIKKDQF